MKCRKKAQIYLSSPPPGSYVQSLQTLEGFCTIFLKVKKHKSLFANFEKNLSFLDRPHIVRPIKKMSLLNTAFQDKSLKDFLDFLSEIYK